MDAKALHGTPEVGTCLPHVWHERYKATLAEGAPVRREVGRFCSLPMSFNFCATASCLVQLARGDHQLAQIAWRSLGRGAGPLGVKILHWPGSLLKPWQRCIADTRSTLDRMWWSHYYAACAEAPLRAPCRIRCREGT